MRRQRVNSSNESEFSSGANKRQSRSESTRRTFLSRLGGAAAISAAASAIKPDLLAQSAGENENGNANARSSQSFQIRVNAAQAEFQTPTPRQVANGDEARFPNYIGNFSKGLPHNAIGEVFPTAYQELLEAVTAGTSEAFEGIPLGGSVKLVNPLSGVAFDLEGADSHKLAIPPSPSVTSRVRADEMIELYWMALSRDVNFTEYASDPTAQAAAKELSSVGDFGQPKQGGQVTAQTLFRGFTPGDLVGPYVSQLIQTPFNYGQYALSGQAPTYVPNVDYMTTQIEWLTCQNGQGPFLSNQIDPEPRYFRNGRDLAAYVHADHDAEAFYNAALRLYAAGAPPNPGNPYRGLKVQAAFGTFGSAFFLALLGEAAVRALKAMWYAKWFVHRTVRPEAYGGFVHLIGSGQASYPIHSDVLNSEAVKRTETKYGTRLLSCAFPEGCPQHPSYAQGHAVVAGASATLLKAAFDGSVQFNTLKNSAIQVASDDGLSLVDYTGPDANEITVNGEINKLASNIGNARNFASVHWRSDYTEGLRMGEAVALSILRDQRHVYAGENFSGFTITKFDGTTVTA